MYYLIPRLFGKHADAQRARDRDCTSGSPRIGIVLYIAAMWIAGVMQGLMWRAVNPDGTLVYTFVESVKATYPFYLSCVWPEACCTWPACCVMAWNVVMTVRSGRVSDRRRFARRWPPPERRHRVMSEANTPPSRPSVTSGIETSNFLMIVLILVVGRHRRPGRDRAAVLPAQRPPQPVAGREAVRPRCSSPGATSTFARVATTATRR